MDKKTAMTILVAGLGLAVWAEKQPLERYQSIIDRQMFGPLPKDFDPEKLPSEVARSGSAAAERQLTKEQEVLQSAIRFSVINVERDGKTAVGFTDSSDPKAPVHYYLRVGETQNGWNVKEADPMQATMTLVRESDGVEVTLKLGDSSGKDSVKAGSAGAATVSAATAPAVGERRPGLLGAGGSLRARRMQRQQEARAAAAKQQEEQAAKDAERQAQAEQEKQQREQERAEQRQQLLAIQEELKKVREQKAAAAKSEDGGEGGEGNSAE